MEKSKVYYSDLRARPGTNLPKKLQKLIKAAGIGNIDFEKISGNRATCLSFVQTMQRQWRMW